MIREHLKQSSQLRWVVETLAIAALYYFTGKLGQLMAIPPGNITVVWPPSGIALGLVLILGKRSLPGIFLGAYLVNSIGIFESTDISLLIASQLAFIGIGIGSALQPLFGYFLLNRFNCSENLFDNFESTFKFLFIALAMCVVSSSIGVTSLCLSSTVAWENFFNLWSTWWFGDSVGVLIFTPLVLAISQQTLNKALVLIALLIVGMSFSYISSKTTREQAEEAWYSQARHESNRLSSSFELWLSRGNLPLGSLATLIKGSESITEDEFQTAIKAQYAYDPEFFPRAIAYAVRKGKQDFGDPAESIDEAYIEGSSWPILYSTETDDLLSEGRDLSGVSLDIRNLFLYALNNPNTITALPRVQLSSEKYYAPTILAVKHQGEIGILIGLIDLKRLISGLQSLVVPEGMGLRTRALHLNGEIIHSKFFYDDERTANDILKTFPYDFTYAAIPIHFEWDLFNDFLGGPKTIIANFILISGVLGTVFIVIFLCIFLFAK